MAERSRAVATLLSVANFEDQLHAHRIPEVKMDWWLRGKKRAAASLSEDETIELSR